jgi:hypothetical protein
MSLYTQNFNLSTAPLAAPGAVTLKLDFFNINAAPGAPVSASPSATPATGIPTPIVDANGLAIEIKPYLDFDHMSQIGEAPSDQSFLNYAIATNSATLASIGTATSFAVGTVTFAVGTTASSATVINFSDAVSAFNAAMNALLTGTLDTAGGRSAIQFVNIDTITKDLTSSATTGNVFSPTMATVVDPTLLNTHMSEGPEVQGPPPSEDSIEAWSSNQGNLNLNGAQLNGLVRLKVALGSDPAIGDVKFQEILPTTSSGLKAAVNGQTGITDYDPNYDSFFFDPLNPDFQVTAGQPFTFTTMGGAVVPGGLVANTAYYAVNVIADEITGVGTFQLSSTPGGGVIDLTGKVLTGSSGTTTITSNAHGFMQGDAVKFSNATAAGGLTPGATYYVLNPSDSPDTFQLSLTPDGNPVTLTAVNTSTLSFINLNSAAGTTVHALTPTIFAANINYSVTAANGAITFTGGDDLAIGDAITFGSSIGASLTAGTEYYVKTFATDGKFTVAASTASTATAITNATVTSGKILASNGSEESSAYYGIAGYQTLDSVDTALITGLTVDFPAKIAVAMNVSSAPQFNAFPLDVAILNAIGSLGDGMTLNINMTPQVALPGSKLVTQFVSVSLAQADAIADNGVAVNLVGLEPKDFADDFQLIDIDASFVPTNVFKIRDSATNLQAMTVEQANNLDTFIHSIVGGEAISFGPQFIDVTPITATGSVDTATVIKLSFDVAQALSNNNIRISLGAKVATSVGGAFGTVTGEDLLHLVDAGVDKIDFDNSTTLVVAPAVGVDPFAGQNVRSVVLSSQDLAPISKMNIVGLKGNNTIDVTLVVDDSNGSVSVSGTLLAKMGVDRIVADDGMLDLHLNDARNLMKITKDNPTPPMLGSIGDKSDVNLIIDSARDFANTKAPAIAQYAKSGIDIITYSGELNFLNSLSQSKNLIDTVSAGVKNGISFDLEQDIHLNIGVLSSAGIGAGLLATVNNLGNHIYLNSRDSGSYMDMYDYPVTMFDQLELQSSGMRSDWVSVNNMSLVGSSGNSSEIGFNNDTILNNFASMTKVLAKANGAPGAVVMVDMQSASDDYGYSAANILHDIYNFDGFTIMQREMLEFGKTVTGIKNLYADFRVSGEDYNQLTQAGNDDGFQSALINNFSKMGFKGIVVDENSINDYAMLDNETAYSVGRWTEGEGLSSDVLPLSQFSQSLDIVYHLDAASSSSSVGLSSYLYENGSVTDEIKDDHFDFKSNVGTIDRIIISNGQDGDLSLDLSEFGVYGSNWTTVKTTDVMNPVSGSYETLDTTRINDSNFASMITHTVNGGKATTANDMFEIHTSSGKYVTVQIVGLTDWTQFNAADLKDASHIMIS